MEEYKSLFENEKIIPVLLRNINNDGYKGIEVNILKYIWVIFSFHKEKYININNMIKETNQNKKNINIIIKNMKKFEFLKVNKGVLEKGDDYKDFEKAFEKFLIKIGLYEKE